MKLFAIIILSAIFLVLAAIVYVAFKIILYAINDIEYLNKINHNNEEDSDL